METALKKGLISGTEEELRAVWQIVNAMSALTEEQKVWGNSRDIANIDWGKISIVDAARQLCQIVWQTPEPRELPKGMSVMTDLPKMGVVPNGSITPQIENMRSYRNSGLDDKGEDFAKLINDVYEGEYNTAENAGIIQSSMAYISEQFAKAESGGITEVEMKNDLRPLYKSMIESLDKNTAELKKGVDIIYDK